MVVLMFQEKYAEALPICLALCKQWPSDTIGFSHGVKCLLKLERKEDARRLLENSPDCYRRFALYWAQLAQIQGGVAKYMCGDLTDFLGQPDLGGLLIPLEEMEAEDMPTAATKPCMLNCSRA
jgi:hypothetical protein